MLDLVAILKKRHFECSSLQRDLSQDPFHWNREYVEFTPTKTGRLKLDRPRLFAMTHKLYFRYPTVARCRSPTGHGSSFLKY